MSFASLNLHPDISKAIAQCGYTTPTPIQAKSIPSIVEGKDIVASAQTGTGKTAAFVLPALHSLSTQGPAKKTRILILTPTRELASQVTEAAIQYGKFLRFNIVNLVGGMPYHQQIRALSRGADIIVATPGRLLDHIESKRVDLSHIQMLVLDEADRMLDMGFIDDVEYIAKLTPANRQTLLFSATVDKQIMTIVKHLLKNPVRIDLSNEKLTVPKIDQQFYKVKSPHHKARLLKHFLNDKNIFKAIIFTATKINADKIADSLCDDGFPAAALHGDLRQNVRNRTVEQLRRGKIQFLVATDVAARGIDISDITHVFNYDLPRFCEDYVHRIGRTARAGKSGTAISFVLQSDSKHLQRIERYTGQRIKLNHLDVAEGDSGESGRFNKPHHDMDRHDRESFHDHKKSHRDHSPKHFDRENDTDFSRDRGSFQDRKKSYRDHSPKRFNREKNSDYSPSSRNERPNKKRFDNKAPWKRDVREGREDRGEGRSFKNKRPGDSRDHYHAKPDRDRGSFGDNSNRYHSKRDRDRSSSGDNRSRYHSKTDRDRTASSDKDGHRPFKKRSAHKTGVNQRDRNSRYQNDDPTLRKRVINKNR